MDDSPGREGATGTATPAARAPLVIAWPDEWDPAQPCPVCGGPVAPMPGPQVTKPGQGALCMPCAWQHGRALAHECLFFAALERTLWRRYPVRPTPRAM